MSKYFSSECLPLDPGNELSMEAVGLLLRAIPQPPGNARNPKKYVEKMRASDDVLCALVDLETAQVVAAVDARFSSDACYISKIAVVEGRRRQGIGRRMLGIIGEMAIMRGCERINLIPLVPEFFNACGFQGTSRVLDASNQDSYRSES